MLTERKPPAAEPYATGIWHYARGLAFIARGDVARADCEDAGQFTQDLLPTPCVRVEHK